MGPGIVIAVTGVGAGDMVSSLVAGTDFGTVLLWAIVLGALIKYFLTEGIGRWYMASGHTILQGWRSLGRWAAGYFVIYLFIVTFVFGAAVISAAALALTRCSPSAAAVGLGRAPRRCGFVDRRHRPLRILRADHEVFAAPEVRDRCLLAILLAPNLGELALGFVPRIPEGALHQRPRHHRRRGRDLHARLLHLLGARARLGHSVLDPDDATDLTVGYVLTALFMVAMLIIGAEMLFGTGAIYQRRGGSRGARRPYAGAIRPRWRAGSSSSASGPSRPAPCSGPGTAAPTSSPTPCGPSARCRTRRPTEYLSEKSIYFRGFWPG